MINDLTPQNILNIGFSSLTDTLGILGTEMFVVELKKESFDYTKWKQNRVDSISVDELNDELLAECRENPIPCKLRNKSIDQ